MSFEVFKKIVTTICAKSGGGIRPQFSQEDGRYLARYDDVVLSGNSSTYGVTVRWGSGHQAMVPNETVKAAMA